MTNKLLNNETAFSALVQGEETGLDYFFHAHYKSLCYFIFKITNDETISEELASETFIKLWINRSHLHHHHAVKTWLYTTVRNAAINYLRKQKRLHVNEKGLENYLPSETTILEHIVQTELLKEILDRLELLPPKCRLVFELFYIHGKTYDEISSALSISPHTARNQKLRAQRLLKAKTKL